MERFTLAQAAEWTHGEARGEAALTAVTTDSRQIPPEALFLPIKGERFDAHDFIGKAIENGAAAVMSHRENEEYPVPALYVENTSQALLDLAGGYRTMCGGKVVGVRAGEDEITSQVVIVAEGVNTLLSERCLGNARPAPHQMAVGIKEVFELPAGVIDDRFLLPEGEGAAMLFVGDCTHGKVGGGFLYTNRDSISLGLVATISTAADGGNDTPVYQMLEDFKNHPAVSPIIRGAKMVEHSGHMVPEGGYDMVPQYVFDGALVAGEAAGLCMNMGYQVRGMDFAVASGRMAAEAAVEAIDAGDVSAAGLSGYKRRMEDSFVIKDLATFRKWPHVMEGWDAMFNDYPTMAAEVFNAMFSVDGRPQEPLRRRIMPIIKKRGLFKTANEVRKAVSAL